MNPTFSIKQGDLLPAIGVHLIDGDGSEVALPVGTTVRFKWRLHLDRSVAFDAAATVVDGPTGHVEYSWGAGDTDLAGIYDAEFEVTSAGQPATFPNDGYIKLTILDDIDLS